MPQSGWVPFPSKLEFILIFRVNPGVKISEGKPGKSPQSAASIRGCMVRFRLGCRTAGCALGTNVIPLPIRKGFVVEKLLPIRSCLFSDHFALPEHHLPHYTSRNSLPSNSSSNFNLLIHPKANIAAAFWRQLFLEGAAHSQNLGCSAMPRP